MIICKSSAELEVLRQSGRIVGQVLDELEPLVRPGIRTRDLDLYAEKRTRELGGVPAFKGYRGYPASVCVSVNEEIIHGIPSGRILQDGDIVSLDFGVLYEGFYSDSAVTVPVGALFRRGQQWCVYRVDAAGRAHLAAVTVGHRNDRVAETLGGLNEGDRVVVYPADAIRDGTRIAARPGARR